MSEITKDRVLKMMDMTAFLEDEPAMLKTVYGRQFEGLDNRQLKMLKNKNKNMPTNLFYFLSKKL